jgi:hypothetical protein
MDFAAQLANLERAAARAASNSGNGHDNDGNRRRPRDHSPPGGWSTRNQRSRYHHHHHGDDQHQRQEITGSSLDTLKRLGYGLDPQAWTPKTDRSRPHICLLAVTIDDLPYEHIWQAWANEAVGG